MEDNIGEVAYGQNQEVVTGWTKVTIIICMKALLDMKNSCIRGSSHNFNVISS